MHTHAKVHQSYINWNFLMILDRYYLVNSKKIKQYIAKIRSFLVYFRLSILSLIFYQKYVDCMLCEGNYAEACIFDAHSTLPPQWYRLSHFLHIITNQTTISYPYLIVVYVIGSFILSIVASRSFHAAATNYPGMQFDALSNPSPPWHRFNHLFVFYNRLDD